MAAATAAESDQRMRHYELAREHMKHLLCDRRGRRSCLVAARDFGQWGVGVQLYFEFTCTFAFVALAVAVLYLPLLLLCLEGNSLNGVDVTSSGFVGEYIVKTTIPNLGLPPNDAANATNATRIVQVAGEEYDIRDITFSLALLDMLASLLILVTLWYFEVIHIPRIVKVDHDEWVTPQMYTIFVDCLPRRLPGTEHETYAERLKHHFEELLTGRVRAGSARKGLTVLHVEDQGDEHVHDVAPSRCACCCRRAAGYDSEGRRVGTIVEKLRPEEWFVMWHKTDEDPNPKPMRCIVTDADHHGELYDAHLLSYLESLGMKPVRPDARLREGHGAVVSVNLQWDFAGQLRKIQREARLHEREVERKLYTSLHGERQPTRGAALRRKVTQSLSTKKKQITKRVASSHFLQKIGAVSRPADGVHSRTKLEERDVVGAFVVFNETSYREYVHLLYQRSRSSCRCCLWRRLRFQGSRIRVFEAQAPNDVFWENLDFPPLARRLRQVLVVICCAFLCTCVVLVVAFAKAQAREAAGESFSASNCTGTATEHNECNCTAAGYSSVMADDPPGIKEWCTDWLDRQNLVALWSVLSSVAVVAAGVAAGWVVSKLALWERPRSLLALNDKVMGMTTVVYVLLLGLVRLLVNAKWPFTVPLAFEGELEDLNPEWYAAVGTWIAVTLGINALFPLFAGMQTRFQSMRRHFGKSRKRLLADLLELYTPPDFPFALRHAQQLSQQFVALVFCSGMPAIAMLMPLTYILYFWVDKHIFLHASKAPPRHTEHLMLNYVRILQLGVALHAAMAIWVYSNERSSPSHVPFPFESVTFGSIDLSTGNGLEGSTAILNVENVTLEEADIVVSLAREMLKLSAIPSSSLLCFVLLSFVLRMTCSACRRARVVEKLKVKGVRLKSHWPKKRRRHWEEEGSFRSEVYSMKRRGLQVSYDLRDVPGYTFLHTGDEKRESVWHKHIRKVAATQEVAARPELDLSTVNIGVTMMSNPTLDDVLHDKLVRPGDDPYDEEDVFMYKPIGRAAEAARLRREERAEAAAAAADATAKAAEVATNQAPRQASEELAVDSQLLPSDLTPSRKPQLKRARSKRGRGFRGAASAVMAARQVAPTADTPSSTPAGGISFRTAGMLARWPVQSAPESTLKSKGTIDENTVHKLDLQDAARRLGIAAALPVGGAGAGAAYRELGVGTPDSSPLGEGRKGSGKGKGRAKFKVKAARAVSEPARSRKKGSSSPQRGGSSSATARAGGRGV